MTGGGDNELEFIRVALCSNPMECEIYPASLRERDIPHRTEWEPGGKLAIMVPREWQEDARESLENASRVFFGGQAAPAGEHPASGDPPVAIGPAEEEEETWGGPALFGRDGLPSPEESSIRAVWPAWALAALPGTGLGHLYAGKFQMFLYLAFLSVLGVLFFQFTRSYWSFLLNLFSWSMDLGFAAYHVKEHNRRARRARRAAEEAERRFLGSL